MKREDFARILHEEILSGIHEALEAKRSLTREELAAIAEVYIEFGWLLGCEVGNIEAANSEEDLKNGILTIPFVVRVRHAPTCDLDEDCSCRE